MTKNDIVETLITCFDSGGKVLICGNGGSASQSDHFMAEMLCKVSKERRPLPAIALTNAAVLTSIANDFNYESVFTRQIAGLANKNDLVILLSTSGKSPNIVHAKGYCKKFTIPYLEWPREGKDTQEIQENQLRLIHETAQSIEDHYSNPNYLKQIPEGDSW